MPSDNMTLSITILLTGFAVVFTVLLMLIGIIKLYGTVIYNIQTKNKDKKVKVAVVRDPEPQSVPEPVAAAEDDDAIIAVISAAVYSMYSPSQVRIRSIRRSPARSNAWRSAGLSDNLRSF